MKTSHFFNFFNISLACHPIHKVQSIIIFCLFLKITTLSTNSCNNTDICNSSKLFSSFFFIFVKKMLISDFFVFVLVISDGLYLLFFKIKSTLIFKKVKKITRQFIYLF